MSAYEHKHTGEIREQETSPGEDWIMIQPMGLYEMLTAWIIVFGAIGFLIWLSRWN